MLAKGNENDVLVSLTVFDDLVGLLIIILGISVILFMREYVMVVA
jgi:hypothetical protein